jgi:hypothetical protein
MMVGKAVVHTRVALSSQSPPFSGRVTSSTLERSSLRGHKKGFMSSKKVYNMVYNYVNAKCFV